MISYENKLIDVMDNKIKNLEPTLYKKIYEYFIDNRTENRKDTITNSIREYVGINKLKKGTSYTSVEYWIVRGWKLDPMKKVREYGTNRSYDNSPYRKEYWINKGYSKEDSLRQIRIRRSTNKEYWINKGYSKEDAINKVLELQKERNKKSNLNHYNGRSPVDKEYWINKGYSEEDSKKLQYNRQNTYGDDKQVELYGYPDALYKKYPIGGVRDSLYNKNIIIHEIINISDTYDEYKKNYKEYKKTLKGHASKESLTYLIPMYNLLKEKYTLYFGACGFKEKYFKYKNGKFYRYDFLIDELKIIYEYDGMYHFSNIYGSVDNYKKIELEKNKYAKTNGYKIYRLSVKNKFEENVKIIYNSFIENNVKYHYLEDRLNKFYETFYDMENLKIEN